MSTVNAVDKAAENEDFRVRSTRSNNKVFEHVMPRIDQELYQADMPNANYEIPHRKAGDSRDVNWYNGTHLVHSVRDAHATAEFLAFSRNLCGQSCGSGMQWCQENSHIPLESDELALEYLLLHNYDVEKAKFNLMCRLSRGKDLILTTIEKELIGKKSLMTMFNETKDILLRAVLPMRGKYDSVNELQRDYSIILPKENISSKGLFPDNNIENQKNPTAIEEGSTIDIESSTAEDFEGGDNNKRYRLERPENKRRKGLFSRITTFLETAAPSVKEALNLLDEAIGDNNGNSEKSTSEDLNIALGELLTQLMTTRLWVAKVFDTIHSMRFNLSLTSNNNTNSQSYAEPSSTTSQSSSSQPQLSDLRTNSSTSGSGSGNPLTDPLRQLLVEAANLPLKCSEEYHLRCLVKEVEQWTGEVERFLTVSDASSGAYFSKFVSICGEKSHSLLDIPGTSQAASSSSTATSDKLSPEQLSELLWRAKRCPIPLPDAPRLEAVYSRAQKLINDVENFLDLAEMSRTCRHKNILRRIPFDDAQTLWNTASSFPVVIQRTTDMKTILDRGLEWQKEVLEAKGTIPLKRVEALLAAGKRLPFNYSSEVELLHDRRQQARQWLDKLKKTFQKGARSTRKAVASGEANVVSEKPQLSDIKQMVCLGEQLYHEDKNKDLNKALGVLDAAEDWVARVREVMSMGREEMRVLCQTEEGYDAPTPSGLLQSLLKEADSMPVMMEEAVLIRAYLRALDWATKTAPLLESRRCSLSDLQAMKREILQIRTTLPQSPLQELSLPELPEEAQLKGAIKAVESWLERFRRVTVTTGVLRRGIPADRIRALVVDADTLVANVDAELSYMRNVLSSVNNWLDQYAMQLAVLGVRSTASTTWPPVGSTGSAVAAVELADSGGTVSTTVGNKIEQSASSLTSPKSDKEASGEVVQRGGGVEGDTSAVDVVLASRDVEEATMGKVSMSDLTTMVSSAGTIAVDLPETKALTGLLANVNSWLDDVESWCPRRLGVGKRKVGHATITTSTTLDKRRPLRDFLALHQRGAAFNVDLTDELQRIQEVIQVVQSWDNKTLSTIQTSVSQMNDVVDNYLKLSREAVPPMPFLVGVGATAEVIKSKPLFITVDDNTYQYDMELDVDDDCEGIEDEEEIWEEFQQNAAPLVALMDEYETTVFGASPLEFDSLATFIGCVHWIEAVRDMLLRPDWGDIPRRTELMSMFADTKLQSTAHLRTTPPIDVPLSSILQLVSSSSAADESKDTVGDGDEAQKMLVDIPVEDEAVDKAASLDAPYPVEDVTEKDSAVGNGTEVSSMEVAGEPAEQSLQSISNGPESMDVEIVNGVVVATEDDDGEEGAQANDAVEEDGTGDNVVDAILGENEKSEASEWAVVDAIIGENEKSEASEWAVVDAIMAENENSAASEWAVVDAIMAENEKSEASKSNQIDEQEESAIEVVKQGGGPETNSAQLSVQSDLLGNDATESEPTLGVPDKAEGEGYTTELKSEYTEQQVPLSDERLPVPQLDAHVTLKSEAGVDTEKARTQKPKKYAGKVDPSLVIEGNGKRTRDRQNINWQDRLNELVGVGKEGKRKRVKADENSKAVEGDNLMSPERQSISDKMSPNPHIGASSAERKMLKGKAKRTLNDESTTVVVSGIGKTKMKLTLRASGVEDVPQTTLTIPVKKGPGRRPLLKAAVISSNAVPSAPTSTATDASGGHVKKRRRSRFGEDVSSEPGTLSKRSRMQHDESSASADALALSLANEAASKDPKPTGVIMKAFEMSGQNSCRRVVIPEKLEKLCMLWYRLLQFLLERVDEAHEWGKRASKLINAATSTASKIPKKCKKQVMWLLRWASEKKLRLKMRKELESCIIHISEWEACVRDYKVSKQKITIDAMKTLIRRGEKLLFNMPEMDSLQAAFNDGKNWISKFERLQETKASNVNYIHEMRSLVNAAETIPLDLTSYTTEVEQSLRVYCLCRLPFSGEMIGCDGCDEWFHLECLGVNKSLADKMETFTCIRCSVRSAFTIVCQKAASAVNRWLLPSSDLVTVRDRESKQLLRRKQKEEKEIARIRQEIAQEHEKYSTQSRLASAGLAAESSAPSPAAPMDTVPAVSADTPTTASVGDLTVSSSTSAAEMKDQTLGQMPSQLNTNTVGVPVGNTESVQDKKVDSSRVESSTGDLSSYTQRMHDLDVLLNAESAKLHRTKADEEEMKLISRIEVAKRSAIVDWMLLMKKLLWPTGNDDIAAGHPVNNGVPAAVESAWRAAETAGIQIIPEIGIVKSSFQVMGWLHRVMQVTRGPSTTNVLRRILEEHKKLGLTDDKIFRTVHGLYQRGTAWKSKARRLLSTGSDSSRPNYEQDLSRALALTSEVLPIRTRLKDSIANYSNVLQSAGVVVPTGKKGSKAAAATTCPIVRPVSNYSTDEERTNPEGTNEANSWSSSFTDIRFPLASIPDLWPPKLSTECVPSVPQEPTSPSAKPTSAVCVQPQQQPQPQPQTQPQIEPQSEPQPQPLSQPQPQAQLKPLPQLQLLPLPQTSLLQKRTLLFGSRTSTSYASDSTSTSVSTSSSASDSKALESTTPAASAAIATAAIATAITTTVTETETAPSATTAMASSSLAMSDQAPVPAPTPASQATAKRKRRSAAEMQQQDKDKDKDKMEGADKVPRKRGPKPRQPAVQTALLVKQLQNLQSALGYIPKAALNLLPSAPAVITARIATSSVNASTPSSAALPLPSSVSSSTAVVAPVTSGEPSAPINIEPVSSSTAVVAPVTSGEPSAPINTEPVSSTAAVVAPAILGEPSAQINTEPVSSTAGVVAPAISGEPSAQINTEPVSSTTAVVAPATLGEPSAPINTEPVSSSAGVVAPATLGEPSAQINTEPVSSTAAVVAPAILGEPSAPINIEPVSSTAGVVAPATLGEPSAPINTEPVSSSAAVVAPEVPTNVIEPDKESLCN